MSAGQAVAYLIMLVRRCRAVRETGPVTADSDAKVLPDLLSLPALPVRTVLPALLDEVDRRGAAVLVAPPGTGKTTLLPLALGRLRGTRGAARWPGHSRRSRHHRAARPAAPARSRPPRRGRRRPR